MTRTASRSYGRGMPPTPSPTRTRTSWRGRERTLVTRVTLTYAAVAGAVLIAVVVGFPVAHLASQQGEGLDGLGYFVLTLGAAAVGAVLLAAIAAWLLGLGWVTALGLLAVVVPVTVAALLQSGLAGVLVAVLWPAVVALAVHGRPIVAAAVAVVTLVVGAGGGWALEQREEAPRAAAITAELEETGLTLYGPPDDADVEWDLTVSRPGGSVAAATAQHEAEAFARLLVERSPEWLGQRSRDT